MKIGNDKFKYRSRFEQYLDEFSNSNQTQIIKNIVSECAFNNSIRGDNEYYVNSTIEVFDDVETTFFICIFLITLYLSLSFVFFTSQQEKSDISSDIVFFCFSLSSSSKIQIFYNSKNTSTV